jgi:hypothetical protein
MDVDYDWQQSVPSYGRSPPPSHVTEPPLTARWLSALAAGLRSAFWWLRENAPRRPILTTLAIGITAVLAMLVAPASCAAGLGAIAVAEATRSGATHLASVVTP